MKGGEQEEGTVHFRVFRAELSTNADFAEKPDHDSTLKNHQRPLSFNQVWKLHIFLRPLMST